MTQHKELHISTVCHKAYIKVNEHGTEAAAATGVSMAITYPLPLFDFRADHPFLFAIRDRITGSILFFRHIMDPTQEGS